MGNYNLKLNGEIINKTKAESYELALEYFCRVKNLSKNKLVELFKIEKDGDRN